MLITPEISTCPYCKTQHRFYQTLSGNTIGATFYSDGFVMGSMYPNFRVYGKCVSCKAVYKLDDALDDEGQKIDNLPDLPEPDLYDYVKYLESVEKLAPDDEEYIRTKIWWFFNDRDRISQPIFSDNADKTIWRHNILVLISLIYNNDPEALIKKAELERNLGRFRHCRSLLKEVTNTDYQNVKRQMLKRCFYRQRKVFVIES